MPLSILAFLTNNWKLIAVLVSILVVYGYGVSNGKGSVQAQWDASLVEIQLATQKEVDRLQALANQKSMEFETELAKQKLAQQKISRRLKNEIAKNSIYTSCVIPADGVQLFRDSVSKGNAPSELNR